MLEKMVVLQLPCRLAVAQQLELLHSKVETAMESSLSEQKEIQPGAL
jgi:hypothetical protein